MVKVRRGTKGEIVQARVTPTKKQTLDRYAELQETTTSELIRKLIDEYILVIEQKMKVENSLHSATQTSYNSTSDPIPTVPLGSR